MFTWEEAGLLRSLLLILKWTAILIAAAGVTLVATALIGCPGRLTAAHIVRNVRMTFDFMTHTMTHGPDQTRALPTGRWTEAGLFE